MTDLRYPLHYPVGWPRSRYPQPSRFDPRGNRTFAQARDSLLRELNRLGATSIVLSTNIPLRGDGLPSAKFRQPEDHGVAVYFRLEKRPMVLACDAWDAVIDNVWAIAKHVEALRGQQRWGVGTIEQAFMGYQALPESVELPPDSWWVVLGVAPTAGADEIRAAYRKAAKTCHPDVGGDREVWDQIQHAYEQGLKKTNGGDRHG